MKLKLMVALVSALAICGCQQSEDEINLAVRRAILTTQDNMYQCVDLAKCLGYNGRIELKPNVRMIYEQYYANGESLTRRAYQYGDYHCVLSRTIDTTRGMYAVKVKGFELSSIAEALEACQMKNCSVKGDRDGRSGCSRAEAD